MANSVTIVVDAKDSASGVFKQVKDNAGGLGKQLGDVGKIAGGFLAGGVIAAGVKQFTGFMSGSVDAAKNLGESLNAVNVVFKESANKILDWGKSNATAFGLSSREFNQLVTPLGAMLQNYGFSADEAADKSIALAKRAADMASVFNVDVGQALEAIQAGLRGEADPLEKFGVGLNAAAIAAKAMEMAGKGVASSLTDQEKKAAALALIFEQTSKVEGDFANTSDGLANSQRIAAAKTEELQAKIGEKLIPVSLKITEIKLKLTEALVNNLIPALSKTGTFFEGLVVTIKPLLELLAHHPQIILAIVGAFAALKALQMAQHFLQLFSAANQWVLAAKIAEGQTRATAMAMMALRAAIMTGGLLAAFYALPPAVKAIKNAFTNADEKARGFAEGARLAGESISHFEDGSVGLDRLRRELQRTKQQMDETAHGGFGVLEGAIAGMVQTAVDEGATYQQVMRLVKEAGVGELGEVKKALDGIRGTISENRAVEREADAEFMRDLKHQRLEAGDAADHMVNKVKPKYQETLDAIRDAADGARNALSGIFQTTTVEELDAERALNALEMEEAELEGRTGTLSEAEKARLDKLRDELIPHQRNVIDQLRLQKEGVELAAEAQTNALPSMSAWSGGLQEQIDKVNFMRIALGELPSILNIKVALGLAQTAELDIIRQWLAAGGAGSIVPMQHGGVVTRPMLTMLGEAGPEAVIPLSPQTQTATPNGSSISSVAATDIKELVRGIQDLVRAVGRMTISVDGREIGRVAMAYGGREADSFRRGG